MISFINKVIRFFNKYLLVFNFNVFIPVGLKLPKERSRVILKHKHGFASKAQFKQGRFYVYPAKYKTDDIVSWSYDTDAFQIPEINENPIGEDRWGGVDVLLPLEKTVWHPEHEVFMNNKMAKAIEKDPMHTSLKDKRLKQQRQTEKAKNHNYKVRRQSPDYTISEI